MNLLLDTHALLWWLADDRGLSREARRAIANPENNVFLSAVVVWEIRIKASIGKLVLPAEFHEVLLAEPFVPLPVTIEHAEATAELPPIHRDPFDRMLVAQAHVEGLTIVTRDTSIPAYGSPVLMA